MFIDDASQKVWVYFSKMEDQVLKYFRRFYATVERETRKKLKCLRMNNACKYTNNEF